MPTCCRRQRHLRCTRLSLAPLLLILVWLTSAIAPGAQDALMHQIGLLVGSEAEHVARTIVSNAKNAQDTGSIAGWWSLGLLFVGATAVFAQLQDVLNRIFRTDATALPGIMAWLRKRVFSLGIVFALGFMLLVSMTLSTILQLVFARVAWMLPLMATAATWVVYSLAFALCTTTCRSVRWAGDGRWAAGPPRGSCSCSDARRLPGPWGAPILVRCTAPWARSCWRWCGSITPP